MRWCLACRRLSGDFPICTSCGRSFGGRLCGGKKRHLNPVSANYCGQCGSSMLLDSANSIPLGWIVRALMLAGLVWLGLHSFGWGLLGAHSLFTAVTGCHDPLVWLLDRSARYVILYCLIYFGLGLIPGGIGRACQKVFRSGVFWALQCGLAFLVAVFRYLFPKRPSL